MIRIWTLGIFDSAWGTITKVINSPFSEESKSIDIEYIKVIELNPILDLLESTRPTDGRDWTLAPDNLVHAVENILHENGRLQND